MNSALWLERTAQVMGDRPALLLGDSLVADYAGFARRAAGLAGSLQRGGVGPGHRIGIFAKNVPDYLTCFYAIWRAGAVAVPVNAKLHPKEAAWILSNAEATSCFVTDALGEGLGGRLRPAADGHRVGGIRDRLRRCADRHGVARPG
jgi:long-chain acyl-CoA synthetase